MPIFRVDWHRVRTHVDQLKEHLANPSSDAATWAAGFFAAAVAALLALITLLATQTSPSSDAVIIFVAAAFAFSVCGGLSLWFGKEGKRLRNLAVDRVCEEMDEIESHHPRATQ